MKKLVRKMFRIKKKQVKAMQKNTYIGAETMAKINSWEKPHNDIIIRSSFNRELYLKYLEIVNDTRKKVELYYV